MPGPRSLDRQELALVSAWRGSPVSTLLGSNVRALAIIPGATGMGAAETFGERAQSCRSLQSTMKTVIGASPVD
jgi:hypothetical protein